MKRGLQFLASLLIGALFLWLSFRHVAWDHLWTYMEGMRFGWIPPFLAVALFSHLLRAKRWQMLIERENVRVDLSDLYAAVMIGYSVNYAVPRLGEISRCVYVSRRQDLPTSSLIGTVIVERAVDLLFLLVAVIFMVGYVITDPHTIRELFGRGVFEWFSNAFQSANPLVIGSLVALGISVFYLFYLTFKWLGQYYEWMDRIRVKGLDLVRMVWDGIMSISRIKNWPLFLFLSLLMWFCYVLMSYIPFWMFHMAQVYHLSLWDALTLTVIASIGITLPSPGGMGTYHWFVKQALWVLYGIPQVTGLAYAFITYLTAMLMFMVFTPIIVIISRALHSDREVILSFRKLFRYPFKEPDVGD